MQLFLKKHSDEATRIVSEYINPLLDLIRSDAIKREIIVSVAPALHRNHKTTAITLFRTLEPHRRDLALTACARFILKKHLPSDPYEDHDNGYAITYQEAIDVMEIAQEISRDNLVYELIVAIADTLVAPRISKHFPRQQKADLFQSIERLSSSKFPDSENIRHTGYLVAAKVQMLRIQRGSAVEWREVLTAARSIPNSADRAYVLAIAGQYARHPELQETAFNEALEVTDSIPCTYDRLARLNDLAGMMASRKPNLAEKCLRSAVSIFRGFDDDVETDRHMFRNLIDTAFKIDEELAASLVSLLDDDPARVATRNQMRRRLVTLRTKKAILDDRTTWDRSEIEAPEMARSAWLALGSLNAGRVNTAGMDELIPALRLAGQYTLQDAFPIFAWIIENSVRRFSGSQQSRSTIRAIFEGAISATELAEVAGASASVAVRPRAKATTPPTVEDRILVQRGERSRAAGFIERWLTQWTPRRIYICDQYFGPTDLDLLMLIQSVVPTAELAVLTSKKGGYGHGGMPLSDAYRTGWRKISDQRPPRAEIVVVDLEESQKSPIHDRSILAEHSGIELGTSWNSLGQSQVSTVSVLSKAETDELVERVGEFLVDRRPEYRAERVLYESVFL